jgi:hypothetical protein
LGTGGLASCACATDATHPRTPTKASLWLTKELLRFIGVPPSSRPTIVTPEFQNLPRP